MNTVQGFCDFNIPYDCSANTTLKDIVLRAVQLGYSAVAINTVVREEVLVPAKKNKGKLNKSSLVEEKSDIPLPPKLGFSDEELSTLQIHGKCVKVFHRLTVILSDPTHAHKLAQSSNAKSYDLIAVCPTTSSAFQHAVSNMDIDVITYNPCEVKDLRFNRRQYRQAMDRGIYFEIPYSFMLQDSTMRKRIIQMSHLYHSIGKSMVNFLNGELSYKSEQNTTGYLNLVITSGALTPLHLRGPYDVSNFGLLLGLTEGQARSALSLSCRSIALHAVTRKTGKSVSYMEETEKLPGQEKWKVERTNELEEPQWKKIKLDSI